MDREPGRPGKGNIGKLFDMRFDIDMVEGGRGIPLDMLRGNMGAPGLGTTAAGGAIELTGDTGCFGGGGGDSGDSTTSLLGDFTPSDWSL